MSGPLPDLLRRAAAEMRRRAEAATPGDWQARKYDIDQYPPYGRCEVTAWRKSANPLLGRSGTEIASGSPSIDVDVEHYLLRADAEHIASWHPTIAILVADLLDEIASEYEAAKPCADGCPNQGEMTWSWPLAEILAREYLREPLAPRRDAAEPGGEPVPTVGEAG